jgi:hypothetical protein
MATKEVIVFIAIHLIVPLIGLIGFLYVVRKIKQNQIEEAPVFELFIVFATYGGLLLVTLTTLFWFWSAMASLGTFYLIIGAPIIMGIIAYRNRKVKDIQNTIYLPIEPGSYTL